MYSFTLSAASVGSKENDEEEEDEEEEEALLLMHETMETCLTTVETIRD